MGTGSTRERTNDVHTTLPFPSNSQVALARSSLRVCTLERPHTTLVISLQERFYSGAFPPLALALYFLFHPLFAASRAPHIYRSRAHRRLLLLAARFRPFPSLTSTTTTTRAREPLACSLPRSLHIPLPSNQTFLRASTSPRHAPPRRAPPHIARSSSSSSLSSSLSSSSSRPAPPCTATSLSSARPSPRSALPLFAPFSPRPSPRFRTRKSALRSSPHDVHVDRSERAL